MAYTTIKKPSDYFNTKLYTGTGSSNAVTGLNFQPDFTWIKQRSGVEQHVLFDAIRGVQKYIVSNTTAAESTTATTLTAFNSDGFTEGGHGMTGANGSTYASWNWKANGAGSSNTDGSINTTATSANTTAGFSISKYTGTGSAGTIGHGLGAEPHVVIVKKLNSIEQWFSYHKPLGNTGALVLNTTASKITDAGYWNSTTPTSSVFSVTSNGSNNASGDTYIAYCFAPKTGFSKFGSYTGNGNADGNFVYLGFKPSFLLIKNADAIGTNWHIYDNKRLGYNVDNNVIQANTNSAELTNDDIDFLSNGFKLRRSTASNNGSGNTMIYMAFAEEPLVGDNPATAR